MYKNLKFLSVSLLATPIAAFSATFTCPTVPKGNYISYISINSNWYLYMLNNNYTIKNSFSILSNINWVDFQSDTLEDSSSIIACSANYNGDFFNVMRVVDYPHCTSNNNGTFTCQ